MSNCQKKSTNLSLWRACTSTFPTMNTGYRPITYILARQFDSITLKGLYFVPSVAESTKTTSFPHWLTPYGKLNLSWGQTPKVPNCSSGGLMALTRQPECVSEWSTASLSLPAGHGCHPHLYVSIQASWQQASILRLSAVSAKLRGSCFFCSSIFSCVNVAKRGRRSGGYRERPRERKKKKKTIWAHHSLVHTPGH